MVPPWSKSQESLGVPKTMSVGRNDILEEKPAVCELCEQICIGDKLGIILKLDVNNLNGIHKLIEDSTHKISKCLSCV